jgi:hypothetical protein
MNNDSDFDQMMTAASAEKSGLPHAMNFIGQDSTAGKEICR